MHLFMATEMVAGIVKSNYVFAKNPSQHMADLYYLINDMQEYHDISRKTCSRFKHFYYLHWIFLQCLHFDKVSSIHHLTRALLRLIYSACSTLLL